MAYPPKIEHAIAILTGLGVSRRRAAPPVYRPLWEFGVPIRPPLFRSFFGNFLVMAAIFGVLFSAITWPAYDPGDSVTFFLIVHGGGAAFCALISAVDFYNTARKLKLPAWSEIDVASRFD